VSRFANMQAQSVNLIHSVLWKGEGVTQSRDCLRREASRGCEVTPYNLLPSTLASHLITHNGNIYRPLAQTATCLHHDEETNISQKTVERSVKQLRARYTTQKRSPCKTLQGRKYTRRNANRETKSIHTCPYSWATGHNSGKFCIF